MESKSQETDAFVVSQEFRVEHFIPVHGPSPRPHDAVAALLSHEDGRCIMQLRGGMRGIFYSGHWGCGVLKNPGRRRRMRSSATCAR